MPKKPKLPECPACHSSAGLWISTSGMRCNQCGYVHVINPSPAAAATPTKKAGPDVHLQDGSTCGGPIFTSKAGRRCMRCHELIENYEQELAPIPMAIDKTKPPVAAGPSHVVTTSRTTGY
jgi:hypothetical protein